MASHRNRPPKDNIDEKIDELTEKNVCDIKFKEYFGQTVTVYVNAGGVVGNGFTGILMCQVNNCIRLLVRPAVPPTCSKSKICNGSTVNPLFCTFCPYVASDSLGTMVEIPVAAIVAFVHNVLSTR